MNQNIKKVKETVQLNLTEIIYLFILSFQCCRYEKSFFIGLAKMKNLMR